MRRVLHILLMIAVLCCGIHLGEDAAAHEGAPAYEIEHATPLPPDDADDPCETGKVAHAGHHHCPVASDPSPGALPSEIASSDALLFCRPVAALRSRSLPPPVEPPAA